MLNRYPISADHVTFPVLNLSIHSLASALFVIFIETCFLTKQFSENYLYAFLNLINIKICDKIF